MPVLTASYFIFVGEAEPYFYLLRIPLFLFLAAFRFRVSNKKARREEKPSLLRLSALDQKQITAFCGFELFVGQRIPDNVEILVQNHDPPAFRNAHCPVKRLI